MEKKTLILGLIPFCKGQLLFESCLRTKVAHIAFLIGVPVPVPISIPPVETLAFDLLSLADQIAVYSRGAMATVLFATVTAKDAPPTNRLTKIRVETSGDVHSQTESPPRSIRISTICPFQIYFLRGPTDIYCHIIITWTVFPSLKGPMSSR